MVAKISGLFADKKGQRRYVEKMGKKDAEVGGKR